MSVPVRTWKGYGYGAALCLLVALAGCDQHGSVERAILHQIHRSCASEHPCLVRVRDNTSFSWDKAFFFNDATTEQERTNALGTGDVGFSELQDQLVFLRDGRVVYQESEPTNIEKNLKDQIGFEALDGKNFTFFVPDVVFQVSVESGPDGPWYLLRPTR